MKKITYLLALLLFGLSFSAFSQDPCDGIEDEIVCVEFEPGLVFPMSACEAELMNLPIVDCEDYGIVIDGEDPGDWGNEGDCDCDYSTDEIICVDFGGGEIGTLHPCDLECFDWFFEVTVVDCGELIYGCTDPMALNYNEEATVNDGSCEYEGIEECDCNWEEDNFICVSWFDQIFEVHACEVECGFWAVGFGEEEFEVVDCGDLVYGCTDPMALNYDENATVNDGSCEYDNNWDCDCDWESDDFICVSWFDQIFEVHACEVECGFWELGIGGDELVVIDCDDLVYGCTDPSALNYDEAATADDGSCEYDWTNDCDCDWESEDYVCLSFEGQIMTIHACELECGFWGDGLFGDDFEIVDCEDLVYGCTDPSALNYDETANADDGSCEYDWTDECDCDWESDDFICVSWFDQIFEVHACEVECGFWEFGIGGDELVIVDCGELVYGCTDPSALNYDEAATADDGSCEYDWTDDCDCDWEADNYVCLSFGGQIMTVHACEIECGFWGDGLFGNDFEIVDCEDLVYGCTDPSALNYDETATADDGSCEYDWTDECDCDWEADNYVCLAFGDEIITVHACEIECGFWGDGIFGNDFEIVDCENDVEDLLEDFYGGGQFNADNFQDIGDFLIEFLLFPNPIDEGDGLGIFIDSNMEGAASIDIYNGVGQKVISERASLNKGKNNIELDVQSLESGLYYTVVTVDNGTSVTEKFIKN